MAAKNKNKVSQQQFETLLHGNTSTTLRRALGPRRFKRLKQEARRRGLTLEGLVSGQPTHLKERSRRGIRRDASRTIDSIYKPVEATLTSEEGKVTALDDKRKLDNQYFMNWLANEQEKLRTHAREADLQLQNTQRDVQTNMDTAWRNAQTAAVEAVQTQAGTVSDVSEANALKMEPERARAAQIVANERAKTASTIGTSDIALEKISGATTRWMLGQDQKRQAETTTLLKDIAGKRFELGLQKAGDTEKEVARLLGVELDKANANREFAAALDKLGLDRDELKFKQQEALRDLLVEKLKERGRNKRNQADIEQDQREEAGRNQRLQTQIGADMKRLERELAAGKYADSGGKGKGKKGLTPAKRREYKSAYNKVYGQALGERVTPQNWFRRYKRALRRDAGRYEPLLLHFAYMHAAYGRLTQAGLGILRKDYGFWAHDPGRAYRPK